MHSKVGEWWIQRDGRGLTRVSTWLDSCELSDHVWLSTSSTIQLSSPCQTWPYCINFAASITVEIMPIHRPFPPAVMGKTLIRVGPLSFASLRLHLFMNSIYSAHQICCRVALILLQVSSNYKQERNGLLNMKKKQRHKFNKFLIRSSAE